MIEPTPNPAPTPPTPAPVTISTTNVHVDPDWFQRFCWIAFLAMFLLDSCSGKTPVVPPAPPIVTPPVTPPKPPATDLTTVGHDFAVKSLAGIWGDSMNAAGSTVESGGSMSDAAKVYQASWDKMKASFGTSVAPSMEKVLPSGTALDSTNRAAVAKALKDIGAGAKSVK